MFTCQRKECGKSFKPKMEYDSSRDKQTVTCPHCGALHVEVHADRAPGAPTDFTFRLDEKQL